MSNTRSTVIFWLLVILVLSALAGLTWTNYRYASDYPGGNDFLSRWVGTRYFLLRGWSPYSSQTSEVIQNLAYGKIANEDEDKMLFVYPFYSTIIFAPFALIGDYAIARSLWMTVLQIALVLITGFSLSMTKWKPPIWLLAILFLFSLGWYHGFRPTINGNASIIVALFIVLGLVSIQKERDIAAGFWLAISTIKPQMVILVLLFTILWAVSKRRWNLIVSFFGGIGLLVASSSLFIPDWLSQNIRQIISYPSYTLPGTPGEIFMEWIPGVGKQLGWFLSVLFSIILLFEWREALKLEFTGFLWVFCLTAVITNLIGIKTATGNYVIMLPALILVFSGLVSRWGDLGRWFVLFIIIIIFVGLWVLFVMTLKYQDQPIQNSIMFFPFPLAVITGLYWVRWWVLRSSSIALID